MSEFYLNERMMELSVEEAHREAEVRRLQEECRKGRKSWLARQRARVQNRLGHLLVSSGQKLLQGVSLLPPDRLDCK